MKRVNKININTPENYDKLFSAEIKRGHMRGCPSRLNALMLNVTKGMKVIELGCGNSTLLPSIKAKFPTNEVHGLDFSPVVIDFMKKKYPDISWLLGNVLIVKKLRDEFDYVIAGEVLEHMIHPDELLQEMSRICKPDGFLSLSVPYLELQKRGSVDDYHLWEFDIEDIRKLLTPYGETMVMLTEDSGVQHINAWCQVTKNP